MCKGMGIKVRNQITKRSLLIDHWAKLLNSTTLLGKLTSYAFAFTNNIFVFNVENLKNIWLIMLNCIIKFCYCYNVFSFEILYRWYNGELPYYC